MMVFNIIWNGILWEEVCVSVCVFTKNTEEGRKDRDRNGEREKGWKMRGR